MCIGDRQRKVTEYVRETHVSNSTCIVLVNTCTLFTNPFFWFSADMYKVPVGNIKGDVLPVIVFNSTY